MPFTVTVSVSIGVAPPLKNSVNVIVPVGLVPPDRTAESLSVIGVLPSVALVGLGVVAMAVFPPLTHTFTLWEALVVVAVVLVVALAVLLWVVQVPEGSPVKVWGYVKVFGLGSVLDTVPRAPPIESVTVTLPSATAVVLLKSKVAVPMY